MMCVAKVTPDFSSITLSSAVLLITISILSPLSLLDFTVLRSSISILPLFLIVILESAAVLDAVPPTWKVLRVSCVHGSPIDCAAITPTASPLAAIFAVARLLP